MASITVVLSFVLVPDATQGQADLHQSTLAQVHVDAAQQLGTALSHLSSAHILTAPIVLFCAAKDAQGSGCGWATVEFLSSADAQQAQRMSGLLLQGRRVFVQLGNGLAPGELLPGWPICPCASSASAISLP